MAKQKHLDIIKQGVDVWNKWRYGHQDIRPDLSGASLSEASLSEADLRGAFLSGTFLGWANLRRAYLRQADLRGAFLTKADLFETELFDADLTEANLWGANLNGADLRGANLSRAKLSNGYYPSQVGERLIADLRRADLSGANLSHAQLSGVDLSGANLRTTDLSGADLSGATLEQTNLVGANLNGADLRGTHLWGADLSGADLSGADLSGADLDSSILVRTNLTNATLKDCTIYGIAVWDVKLDGAKQLNLTITPNNQPILTVDSLKVAQFIYLLLNNEEIRDVINTITTKVILILGRFTPERKPILEAIRDELRNHNYLPMMFDFDRPNSRDITETLTTLARLARFVIADLTDAKSIPQELAFIVPDLPSVPVQPILLSSQPEYGMFEHFTRFPWVLPIHRYTDLPGLLASLKEQVIEPAEQKAQELEKR